MVARANEIVEKDSITEIPFLSVRLDESFDRIVELNPDLRIEQKANGEILLMSPTGGESGRRNADLSSQLQVWSKQYGGYCFDSSTLFQLPDGSKRSPDASWIESSRWLSLSKESRRIYPPISPDFVIELRSETDPLGELRAKMKEYIANGVKLGWLIDPKTRIVYVYKSGHAESKLENLESVADDEILPGFVLDLTTLWLDS